MSKGKGWNRIITFFHRIEDLVAFAAVFLLALFPFMQVIARIFKTSVAYAGDYMHHLVLVVTFIGGMITSREGRHLSLSLALKIKDPLKTRIHTGIMLIAAMMTTAFCWSAFSFLLNGFDPSKKIGIFPIRLFGLVMMAGYAIMAIRFVTRASKERWNRVIASAGILVGTFIALDPIAKIIAYFFEESPGFVDSLLQFAQSANAIIALPIIILLIIAAVFGAPLFVVLGGMGYMLFARLGEPLGVIANESYEMLISHSIPAIPLFTVAGFLLSESKASERLVRFFKAFFVGLIWYTLEK